MDENTNELFLKISESKVDLQLDTIKELKNRASILMGFNVLFLSIILTKDNNIFLGSNKIALYFVLLSFFLLSYCLFVKGYSKSPKPDKLYEQFKKSSYENVREHLIKEYHKDLSYNEKEIDNLAKIINWAIWIEVVAIMFLTIRLFPLF